jgi:hypothetical protein
VLLMAVQMVFSPLIAAFVRSDGHLPKWLSWFEPTDTPAIGDENFHNNQMSWTKSNYLYAMFWGWRNPAYGFSAKCGIKVDAPQYYTQSGQYKVDIGRNQLTGDAIVLLGSLYRTVYNQGTRYWQYRRAGAWSKNYGWMIELGWNLELPFTDGEVRSLHIYIRPRISLKDNFQK